ncbi:uncharacterized protein [Panulirus ornatus]|uniref:uncharacterized protein n=1 Tax=Panulirus ornatus TaxID=150431 RepID=UPI003A88380B
MSSLLPSEIARLVLGFLEERGCLKASQYLLQELPDLAECVNLRKRGRKVSTCIGNKSLEDMLADYTDSKDHVLDCLKNYPATFSRVLSNDDLLQQIKTITSIVIENKHFKQGMSLGVIGKSKQMSRTCHLQNELHGSCSSLTTTHKPFVMEINTTPIESLPGSSHREPIRVEIMNDACSAQPTQFDDVQDHIQSTSNSLLVTPPPVSHANVEDARGDSIGGDSTSLSLTGPDFDIVPQKRKGSQVKRRSQGSDNINNRFSPVLDNETSFEKILKNLYENTALHEKIAENINRGRNSQNKMLACSDGDGEESVDVTANVSLCGSLKKNKEGSSPSVKGIVGVTSRCKGSGDESSLNGAGDVALLKELDHIVPGIISETTADPAFESLLEEVFGTPQSTPSKSNGSYQAGQNCMQETPMAPTRPLSTPVPPPTTTSTSTMVPQQLPPPFLPLFRPPSSSTTETSCTLSSQTISSASLHPASPNAFHGSISPEHTSPDHIQLIQQPSISASLHSPSCDISTSISNLTSKVPPKKKQKKMQSNGPVVVGSRVTRSATKMSRLASSKGITPSTSEDVAHDATSVGDIKTPSKEETRSPFSLQNSDICPSKSLCGSPVTKCIQDSAASETDSHLSNVLTPSDSVSKALKSKRKKTKNSRSDKKVLKEDERSLGEQLLQEFANFQSSRPDKVSESESSGDSEKIESLELDKRFSESERGREVQTPVSESESYASGAVASSPQAVAFSETTGEEHSSLLTSHKATTVCDDIQTEEAAASAVSSPKSLTSPNKETDLSKNLVTKHSHSESEEVQRFVSVTEPLANKQYDKDVQMTGPTENYENGIDVLTIMPGSTIPVRSTTIPGIASSVVLCNADPTQGQEECTLTELTPVIPHAVPHFEGSFSVEQETGILYPILSQNCTTLSQSTISGIHNVVPASVSTSLASFPASGKHVTLDASTGPLPVTAVGGVCKFGQISQVTQLMQPQDAAGYGENPTILLPPFVNNGLNQGSVINLSGGIKDHQSSMMILQLPEFQLPSLQIIPQSLGIGHGGISANCNKNESIVIKPDSKPSIHQARKHSKGGKSPNAVKDAPVLIAPKGRPSILPHAQTTVFSGGAEYDLQSPYTSTLSHNVSFSMPNSKGFGTSVKRRTKLNKKSKPLVEKDKKKSPKAQRKTSTLAKADYVRKAQMHGERRTRKQTKETQKEIKESLLSKNIISTALSFALNSLSPNKDANLLGFSKSPRHTSPHKVVEWSVEEKSVGELPSFNDYCSEMLPKEMQTNVVLNQAQEATIKQAMLRTSSENVLSLNVETAEKSSVDARFSIEDQKKNTEQDMHVELVKNTDAAEPLNAKFNTSRSPQLKALLHLSQSVSPSMKSVSRSILSDSPPVGCLPSRGSHSAPSCKSSHIRALDFSTPQKHKSPGRSPRKVMASLKFSPTASKSSSEKTVKLPLSNPSSLQSILSPKKKILGKIPEENEEVFRNIDTEKKLKIIEENTGNKKLASEKSPSSLSCLGKRKVSTGSTSEESLVRSDTVSFFSSAGHLSDRQQQHAGQLDTEDEESLVLYFEDDSSSLDVGDQATDTGSVEFFVMPKEASSDEDLKHSEVRELSSNLVAETEIEKTQDFPLALTSHTTPTTVQTDVMGSSDMLSHYDRKRLKVLKTPCKDGELLSSYSNSLLPMTPVCLEPTTPIFPSESRPLFPQDSDLNTPVPPALPKTPAGRSPFIKDYPQGPYSNSSVSTSYYMPSEHSITDSEGCSPPQLENVWETTLIEELSSTTHQVKNSPKCSKSNASPSRMSRKVMGEVIEQEMDKLFSGGTNSSVFDIQVQNSKRSFNGHSTLDKVSDSIDTKLKNPSKGKQGKQRRVPSKKYQNLAESTCSEDEVDHSSQTLSSDLSMNQNYKPQSNISLSKTKVNKRKGLFIAEDIDATPDAAVAERPSPTDLGDEVIRKCRKAVTEKKGITQRSLLHVSDIDFDNGKTVVRHQYCRRRNKSDVEGVTKFVKGSEEPNSGHNVIQNANESQTQTLSIGDGSCPFARKEIFQSDSQRKIAYQVTDSQSVVAGHIVSSPSTLSSQSNVALGTSRSKVQKVKQFFSKWKLRKTVTKTLRKSPTKKGSRNIAPIASKAKQYVSDIFGSDLSFTDESDCEAKGNVKNETVRLMEISQSSACLDTSLKQGLVEKTGNSKRSHRSKRGQKLSGGKVQTSKVSALVSKPKPARKRSNSVRRGDQTPITQQRSARSKCKQSINVDINEVTIEALDRADNTHSRELPEDVLRNRMEKETSESKVVVKHKSKRRSKALKNSKIENSKQVNPNYCSSDTLMQLSTGNELKVVDVVAEIHKPPEILTDVSEGVRKGSEHFKKFAHKESMSNDLCHWLKQPVTPFSVWGSRLRLPEQTKSENYVTSFEDLRTQWSTSLALRSSLSDVNITDTEDDSPRKLLHQTIPEQFNPHPKTIKGMKLSTHSSGCARTISFMNIVSKEVHHHFETESLGEIHNVTPNRTQLHRTGNSGSYTSEPISDIAQAAATDIQSPVVENSTLVTRKKNSSCTPITLKSGQLSSQHDQLKIRLDKKFIDGNDDFNSHNETVTLCAQDSDSVASIPAASISSLLDHTHLLDIEKRMEVVDQDSQKVATSDMFPVMPHKNLLITLSKEGNSPDSSESIKNAVEMLEYPEQQCTVLCETLPAAKERMDQICHSYISKNLPITAQIPTRASPERDEVSIQSQNRKSMDNDIVLYKTTVSCAENEESPRSCRGNLQDRENMNGDFKKADSSHKAGKTLLTEKKLCKKNHLETDYDSPLNSLDFEMSVDNQIPDGLKGPSNLKFSDNTDEILGRKQGDREGSIASMDKESQNVCKLVEKDVAPNSLQRELENFGDVREELVTQEGLCTTLSSNKSRELKKNENYEYPSHSDTEVLECLEETSQSQTEKDSFETLKLDTQQRNELLKKSVANDPLTELRVNDFETKLVEEDSDVLRIEVPSENENDDSDDCDDTVHLTMSDLIDLLDLNLEFKEHKAKRVVVSTQRKRRAFKNSELENKIKGKSRKKHSVRPFMTRKKSDIDKLKSQRGKEKTENIIQQNISKMDGKIHLVDNEGFAGFPENLDEQENFVSLSNCLENPVYGSNDSDVHFSHKKRIRDEESSGDSSEQVKRRESHQSPLKKRRRIQPIRIGEVEKNSRRHKKEWTEMKAIRRVPSGQEENRITSGTQVPYPIDKNDDGIQVHHEKAFGLEYGSLRREVLLNSGAGSVSERSVSSLSSISPGRLLISESPRDLESSPVQHDDSPAVTSPHCYTSTGSPITNSHSTVASNSDSLRTNESTSLDCSIRQLPVNQCKEFVDGIKMVQERVKAESEQSPRTPLSYLIESETSREIDEDLGCGRQRRARHMASELYSGGSLEIAHSTEKQLAIMTNHQHEARGLQMSEESANSLNSMPPTPGKHLFVPPAPAPAAVSSGCIGFSSRSSHESVALPLKKRRKMTFEPEPVKRKQAQRLTKKINISKFLDKIHQSEQQQPQKPK